MSFMFRDRKDTEFDYGSVNVDRQAEILALNATLATLAAKCLEEENRRKDAQLENFYASGL